jgi:hypothetical protein
MLIVQAQPGIQQGCISGCLHCLHVQLLVPAIM